ncbi:MAG: DUF5688 family protein [Enterocloster sp.]|nr:DUF5688 family protein [Enterocloster sp.]
MVYNEFLETMKKQMELALGDGYSLTLRKVQKNNGLVLDGLCIEKDGSPVAPSIYLNPFYEHYLDGVSLETITKKLLTAYQENSYPSFLNQFALSDYASLSSRIAFRLINAASNQSLLKTMPHIPWMDLAVVFYLYIQENEDGIMTAAIYDHHIKTWGITVDELYRQSLINTPVLFPPSISSMSCILETLDPGHLHYDPSLPDTPFYVLTNKNGINGAACILYKDTIKNFAEGMDRNILILPSSIHEVLLLPDDELFSYNDLAHLVTFINQTEVPAQDRLSNQVYRYSRSEDDFSIVSLSPSSVC